MLDRDDDWTGIGPDGVDKEPIFEDLDERLFRECAQHLAGDRGLKQNTVQTYTEGGRCSCAI